MTRPNPNVRSKFQPLIPPAQRIGILLLLQNRTYSVSPGQGKFFFFFSLRFMELAQFWSGIVHHVFSQHTSFQPIAISREHTACRYHAIEPMREEEGP
jgi:hypothetical protein